MEGTEIYEPSDILIGYVKYFEGCSLNAYVCPAGKLTIGYGHTKGVRKGMKITPEQAHAFLMKDLQASCDYVNNLHVCKTQGQFDALVDFCFNVGTGNLSKSTLLKRIKRNEGIVAICNEFMKWIYSKGVKLDGLKKRRKWEADRWCGKAKWINF